MDIATLGSCSCFFIFLGSVTKELIQLPLGIIFEGFCFCMRKCIILDFLQESLAETVISLGNPSCESLSFLAVAWHPWTNIARIINTSCKTNVAILDLIDSVRITK